MHGQRFFTAIHDVPAEPDRPVRTLKSLTAFTLMYIIRASCLFGMTSDESMANLDTNLAL